MIILYATISALAVLSKNISPTSSGRWLRSCFLQTVSCNRFVELMPRIFYELMQFMCIYSFGRCSGITFVDSTMIPVCHNLRRHFNKVFACLVKDGKGMIGWCHGFKLHFICNDSREIITFCLTGANVDDRDDRVWSVFTKHLYGKVFADRGYIKYEFFESLFDRGIHLVHALKANVKKNLWLCGTRLCWEKGM